MASCVRFLFVFISERECTVLNRCSRTRPAQCGRCIEHLSLLPGHVEFVQGAYVLQPLRHAAVLVFSRDVQQWSEMPCGDHMFNYPFGISPARGFRTLGRWRRVVVVRERHTRPSRMGQESKPCLGRSSTTHTGIAPTHAMTPPVIVIRVVVEIRPQ